MKRTINTQRTYNLGQYQNIKIFDETTEIDLELFDENIIPKFRYLQFISIELAYRNYIELQKYIQPYTLEEQVSMLEEMRLNLFEEIKNDLIENGKGEEENE